MIRRTSIVLAVAAAFFCASQAQAVFPTDRPTRRLNVVELLSSIDGTQALVGAVLYVDAGGTLPFSLAELLSDRRTKAIVFAPTNEAFEELLDLEDGTLDGLTPAEIQVALGGLVPATDVQTILLRHVILDQRAREQDGSVNALLIAQTATAADETTELMFSLTADGAEVNDIEIIRGDVNVRNGIVHFIEEVIGAPEM